MESVQPTSNNQPIQCCEGISLLEANHESTTETELYCKKGGSLQSQTCKPEALEIDTSKLNDCLENQSHENNKLANITTSLKRRNVSSVVFFDKLYKSLNLNAMNSSTQHT